MHNIPTTTLLALTLGGLAMGDDSLIVLPVAEDPPIPYFHSEQLESSLKELDFHGLPATLPPGVFPSPQYVEWRRLARAAQCIHFSDPERYNALLKDMRLLEAEIRMSGRQDEIQQIEFKQYGWSPEYPPYPGKTWQEVMQLADERSDEAFACLLKHKDNDPMLLDWLRRATRHGYIVLVCHQDESGRWDEAGRSVMDTLDAMLPGLGDAVADGDCVVTHPCFPAARAGHSTDCKLKVLPRIRHWVADDSLSAEGLELRICIRKDDTGAILRMAQEKPALLRERDGKMLTPLEFAVCHGTPAAVKALLAAGASPNERSADGTPLLSKCFSMDIPCLEHARVLLEAGADPDAKTPDFHAQRAWTPLMLASGRKDSVLLLLQYGADAADADVVRFLKRNLPPEDRKEVMEALKARGYAFYEEIAAED